MRFFIGLVALVAVVSSQGVSNSTSVSPGVVAWIDDKGSVVSSSVPLNVTRIAAGHYCIAGNGTKSPINNGFLPTFVTLQNMGRGSALPLFVQANNGWGDKCNPYSFLSVYVFDAQGTYRDNAFSIAIITAN